MGTLGASCSRACRGTNICNGCSTKNGDLLMATLEEFLTTGLLGSIALGATKNGVRRALGEPEDVSLQKNPAVWKYGALQLAFYKSKSDLQPSLELIGIYFHTPEEQLPERLALAGWVPTGETTVSEFLNWL